MHFRCRSVKLATGVLTGLAAFAVAHQAFAQTWADTNYRYRRPLTLQNTSGTAIPGTEMSAFTYIPGFGGTFGTNTRADGKDVKVYYDNGSGPVDVPQYVFQTGLSNKILFALQGNVPAATDLTENLNAGNTGYTNLPAGTVVSPSVINGDDGGTLLTLPFQFPFKGVLSNQVFMSYDGYLVPGTAQTSSLYGPGLAGKLGIFPYTSDYTVNGTGGPADANMYFSADSTKAVFRWEVAESGTQNVIAKFAVVLYPNGDIRFVYSDTVTPPSSGAGGSGSYAQLAYGVGQGDPALSYIHYPVDNYPTSADMSNHADILYSGTYTPGQATGYWAYYGNPADNGTTGRTMPTSDKMVLYTFDDNTIQGWAVPSAFQATEPATLTASNGVFDMYGKSGGHPMSFAKSQTTILGDQTVYGKVKPSGGEREIALMARATDAGTGYGMMMDGYGTSNGLLVRKGPGVSGDYGTIGTLTNGAIDASLWEFPIIRVLGTGANTLIQARYFNQRQIDPMTWQFSGTSNASDQGGIGLTGWEGGADHQQIDWAIATTGHAEDVVTSVGSETQITVSGKGILAGTIADATSGMGLSGATVTVTPAGGGTSFTVPSDIYGTYNFIVDPGTYNLTFAYGYYGNSTTVNNVTVTADATTTTNATLTSTNLVTNPSFETPDPAAPAIKPLGWYRRDFDTNTANDPNPAAVVAPWTYDTSGAHAHTGTSSVGFVGPNTTLLAWSEEGSVPGQFDTDSRGKGPLVPTIAGGLYHISYWINRSDNTGNPRLRIRDMVADNESDANLSGGGGTLSPPAGPTNGWVQVQTDYTATSNFISLRPYGDAGLVGSVYFDDISAVPVALPTIYRGFVKTSSGAPVVGAAVGVRASGANGMDNPIAYATTDALGRFTLQFIPASGTTYVAQAWLNNNSASTNVPLVAGTLMTITYDPKATLNVAKGKAIIASSGDDNSNKPTAITDGNDGTRWASGTNNPLNSISSANPAWEVIDLGQTVDFSKLQQITILWEVANADAYQLRVSDNPPSGMMDATEAASYGTPIYTAAAGVGRNSYTPLSPANQRDDVITAPSLGSASGRYLEVLMNGFAPGLGNYSIFELKVEATTATLTGKVVDQANQPVANAAVGAGPDAASYAKTDANGNYSLALPVGLGAFSLVAHKVDSGDTVYPVSLPVTVTPTPAGGVIPTLAIGPAVPNVVPTTAAADTDPSGIYDTTGNNLPTNVVDHKLDTRWVTFSLSPTPSPTNPLGFVIDMGAPQTINEIVVNWESAYARAYQVSLSTDGANYTPVYSTTSATGGYSYTAPNGNHFADAITFPSQSAQFIRFDFTGAGPVADRVSMWEVQAANVTSAPLPISSADVAKALQIAGGVLQASPDDKTRLDANGDGKITVEDATKLLRSTTGL